MDFIETNTQRITITLKLSPSQKPFDLRNSTNQEILRYFFAKQGYTVKNIEVAQSFNDDD